MLALGAPLHAPTVLHHAESLVDLPARRLVTYRVPVVEDGERSWREVRDIDSSSRGAVPIYETPGLSEDPFAVIGRAALDASAGRAGPVGDSASHLFDTARLVEVATAWIEEWFS